MIGYFDIHSHILPGVDDGAKDIEQTQRMLHIALEEGIRRIIATPHFEMGNHNTEEATLKKALEQAQDKALQLDQNFQLFLGNEILYSMDIIEALKRGEALTMAGSRYILVEFLPQVSYSELREGLNRCIQSGYIPILAHAERYLTLVRDISHVEEIMNLGAYIQLNLSSILGGVMNARANFCKKLLNRDMVHFLATDAHGDKIRAPYMKEAIAFLIKRYGESYVQGLLWDNPMKMLKDQYI